MAKYCIVGELNPEFLEQYKQEHRAIHRGPYRELLEVIRDSGVREEAVFIYKNLAVIYFEADDIDKSYAMQGRFEVSKKWNELMAPMFASTYEFNASDKLPTLEKVFDLQEQLHGELLP
jgi:L-rhamnose mutarotase